MDSKLKLFYLLSAPVLVSAWLIPNHYPPWTGFYNEIGSAFAMCLLSVALFSKLQRLSLPYPAVFVFMLGLVPLLQFGFGLIEFFGDAILAACYLAGLGLSIIVGANLARAWGARFVEVLAWVCLVGAISSSLLALHQWLGLELGIWLMDVPPNGRPYANLAQPNNLATLLCLGLVATIYLRERGHLGIFVLVLVAAILFSGVAMTRSRTAVLIIIVTVGWIIWGRRKFGLRCSPVEVVIGVIMFVVLWTQWSTLSDMLYLSAESTMKRLQGISGGEVRLVLWQQLLDAAWQRPVFGYGWNQLSMAQIAVVAEYPNTVPAQYGHNLVIDLLIWNGIFLGGFVVLVMGGWLVSQMRQVDSLEPWFGLMFVLVILTHSMLEFPHAYAYFLLPVGLCIGIICDRKITSLRTFSRPAYAVFIVIAFGVVGWVFIEYQRIEADYRLMRFETLGIESRTPQAIAPDVVLLTQLEELIKLARGQAREGMAEDEILWMGRVAHRYPFPPAMMRHALALGLNHRPLEAALELRRLQQIQPAPYFEEVRDMWPSLVGRYPQLEKVLLPAKAM